MKNKILSSVLIFMFAWVAVGALDCGCVFASPIETEVNKATESSEMMDCHGPKETQSKKADDVCCSGCKLESKAPTPPNITLIGPSQSKLSNIDADTFTSGYARVALISKASMISSSFQYDHAHGVSFYNAPIYLAVQSFLI